MSVLNDFRREIWMQAERSGSVDLDRLFELLDEASIDEAIALLAPAVGSEQVEPLQAAWALATDDEAAGWLAWDEALGR